MVLENTVNKYICISIGIFEIKYLISATEKNGLKMAKYIFANRHNHMNGIKLSCF